MKSILKFFMTGIGLILIALGVGAFVFSAQALDVLKSALESHAKEALGSDVNIENISFSREHLGLMLEGFKVANPPEFKEGDALKCEKILLQPSWKTIFASTPAFAKITVQGVELDLRHEVGDGTNIGALMRNLRTFQEKVDTADKGKFPRQIKVEKLAFNSGTLKVKSGVIPIPSVPLDINAFEVNKVNEGQAMPVGKLMGVMLRDLLLEAITLKGVLKPMENVLMSEMEEI